MIRKVCVLDYGSGNTTSVFRAVSRLDTASAVVSSSNNEIKHSSHLILPGVGSFSSTMDRINQNLNMEFIFSEIKKGKPILGICVGMQVFAESGEEIQVKRGLNLIKGEVRKLPCTNLKLPHVGWNSVKFVKPSPLFANLNEESDFYFTHSYAMEANSSDSVVGITNYEVNFCSIVQQGNIFGVQFHPEKSSYNGAKLLQNFLELTC